MSDTKQLYYDKGHGRFEWSGGRYPVALEAETSSAAYDAPWLEFYDLTPEELCKRWNNHERLIKTLENVVDGWSTGEDIFGPIQTARTLLASLKSEKGGEF